MAFKEKEYEEALVELFCNLGYEHKYGREEGSDERSPLYDSVLEESIARINPSLPSEAIDEALRKIRNIENSDLISKNRTFTYFLQNGFDVSYFYKGEQKSSHVILADFDNPDRNSFIIANQWNYIEQEQRIPDIILFLNGMPVVLMELKSPSREDTGIEYAYTQIRNYMQVIPSMFVYNEVCVISDFASSKVGTITSGKDRFMEWKTKDGESESKDATNFEVFFEGMFAKDHLLDIIRNFICFSDEGVGRVFKILAGYHQYYAVKKALESTQQATKTDGKGGVFWHTQGSGKSLSMVFYTHLIQDKLETPTVVVLTDRNNLDDQLFSQFSFCQDFLRQKPYHAESRSDLRKWLEGRQANGIIFSTIQKFEESDEPLSLRRNIIVIADEAHRSHYGLAEKIKIKENSNGEKEAKRVVGTARIIRNSLPNATYIGFTGTPISSKDRSTREVFGDYIDIYDMTQAVKDGATRPVYYESRIIKLNLDKETLALIDKKYEEMADQAEPEVIEKSKHDLGNMEAILGNDKTIASLVKDILCHYEENRENYLTGKAMIVAYSREIAMKIYNRILTLRPDWEKTGKIAVVMTESNKDPEEWHAVIGGKQQREELAIKFKDNESPLKIVIVVDMWLTGFDIPSLATMYFYKPMVAHNLMQAIARVNRVFKDKEGGLVVDYIGLASALKQAMKDYTKRDRDNYEEMNISKTAYVQFQEKLSICQDLLHGYDYSLFFSSDSLNRARLITGAVNFILDEKGKRKDDFLKNALMVHQALSLCSSIVPPKEREEAAFLEAVRITVMRISNQGSGKKISLSELNKQINELLKQSVKSEGVINLFSDVHEDFSIFDEKFLLEVAGMKEKNIALEILKKLINEQVHVYKRTNLVKSEKFSEILEKSMHRYLNGMLTNEQVIEELLGLARQISEAKKEGEDLGLTEEEKAFYDALTKPQAIKDFYENNELIALTKELTERLRKNRTIDWQRSESARAKMRMIVRKLLKDYKYPPDESDGAVETVIKQCELWADNESFDDDDSDSGSIIA